MRKIEQDCDGPLEIAGTALVSANIRGDVLISEGASARVTGEIVGTVTVRKTGALVLVGRVKGAVINEGGAVDIFGFVGRVSDTGDTETWASAGAIIGGQRVKAPSKLSKLSV